MKEFFWGVGEVYFILIGVFVNKTHRIVPLRYVYFTVCEFYLSLKKSPKLQIENV